MTQTMSTTQGETWGNEFGSAYTDRNPQSVDGLEELHAKDYGVPRKEMNEEFLGALDRGIRVLEVGANIGLQLEMLRRMGFTDLLGIDVNDHAIREAKRIHPDVSIIKGNVLDLPFKDGWFDLSYTSGVLIHIAPENLPKAMDEIVRVSGRYVWGFEYFAPTLTNIPYHGRTDLLWKRDFAAAYLERFPGMKLVMERKYPMLGSENVTQMFLLEKA
ncbi:MAG: pseudaminic acid biosynthesis-associated methylase [Patescibacteria group bacterium]